MRVFTALRTLSSGSSDPSGAANIAQYQAHINTSTNLLKIATAVSGDNATYNTLGNITLDNLGHVVAATPTMTGDVTMSSTGFLKVPVGTNAQQPGQSNQPAAAAGQFRYNSDTGQFEGYTTSWVLLVEAVELLVEELKLFFTRMRIRWIRTIQSVMERLI